MENKGAHQVTGAEVWAPTTYVILNSPSLSALLCEMRIAVATSQRIETVIEKARVRDFENRWSSADKGLSGRNSLVQIRLHLQSQY